MSQPITVKPGHKIRLADFDASFKNGVDSREAAEAETEASVSAMTDLAYRLYAENRRALLIVLQGMDTAGKDGTIRHVMRGVSPQSCQVKPFKQPSAEELDHDFLWRIHKAVPAKGNIGIFNRSHYEDVLVVRVHNLVPQDVWEKRYDTINGFERFLVDGGTTIIKIFLHISKDEQKERLEERLHDAKKRWKLSPADVAERKLWDDYQRAYEDALTHCNTDYAPWHIVPANRKWYRNFVISKLLREALEKMDPKFPPPASDLDKLVIE
ncbi:MAG: polyphosphate kinase 2 family protein [Pirellulales bacterium]|nr:polyphosphate kinase 2 family protein [Pirellulales bacterium]